MPMGEQTETSACGGRRVKLACIGSASAGHAASEVDSDGAWPTSGQQ